MSDGRRLAHEVLIRVERDRAWANVTLDAALRGASGLPSRERGLATELVYGTLRRALALDWALSHYSERPIEALDPEVRAALRLGAYQILHLRVPDRAAVHTTVDLIAQGKHRRAKGFINAVLRRLAADGLPPLPDAALDPAGALLAKEGLPQWLYALWAEALPSGELEAVAAEVNQPVPQALRAPSPAARDEAVAWFLEAKGPGGAALKASPSPLAPQALFVEGGTSPDQLPGFEALRLQPQDVAAQLVSHFAVAPGAEPLAPTRVLDACAAPGGKTCHLAQLLPEATVVATELHRRRAERVQQEATRLGLSERVEAHAADATLPLPFAEEGSFDLILLDAPCSGLGTLRRHPEIKLIRDLADLERLADLQGRLLENAARYLRPGGRLVYAVCTWSPQEGPEQVARFLDAHPDFALEPGPDGPTLETWPHREGADGFYAVRLRRAPSPA